MSWDPPIRLSTDGDGLERLYWHPFIKKEFPSYERYWLARVVPVTTRDIDRENPRLKSDAEHMAMTPPRLPFEAYLAHLHYSVLWHLCAAYDLLHSPGGPGTEFDEFVHCLSRLVSALDAADELLARHDEPFTGSDPRSGGKPKRARETWRSNHRDQRRLDLLEYRNHLAHSGALMSISVLGALWIPRLGHFRNYRDWRSLTPAPPMSKLKIDFRPTSAVATDAWRKTLRYLEHWWRWLIAKRGTSVRLRAIAEREPPDEVPPRQQSLVLSMTYFPPRFFRRSSSLLPPTTPAPPTTTMSRLTDTT